MDEIQTVLRRVVTIPDGYAQLKSRFSTNGRHDMLTLLKHLWVAFAYDELFVRRWGRALIMTVAVSGAVFSDQIAALVNAPRLVVAIKTASILAAFCSAAITAGEKNP